MRYTYSPKGVCARQIIIELDDNRVITDLQFVGGCSGNTQGVAALAIGQRVEDVIPKIEHIRCGFKSTSCPAQLAMALKFALDQ